MKVLILYPWNSFWAMGEGSGASSFFRSARGYVDHGHDVHVLMTGGSSGQMGFEEYHGMRLTRLALRRDPMEIERTGWIGVIERYFRYRHYHRRLVRRAREIGRSFRPDVIVAFGPHPVPAARRVAVELGVPNVTRLFGQALILHLDDEGRVRRPLRYLANFAEILAFKTPCAALIVHDDGSRGDVVARRFGVPKEIFHFWRDGIDHSIVGDRRRSPAAKVSLGLEADRFVVTSASRLSPEKNLERLIDMLDELQGDHPELDLLFVGDGPSRKSLEARAQCSRARHRIHFLGAVPRETMPDIFAASDVFASVSDRTNMTNAVLEAMAAEIPIVAFDTGDTSKVVRHEETGLLISPDDSDGLARAVSRLAQDPRLRSKLGSAGRARVESSFETIEQRVRREVELVASLVSSGAANRGGKGSS